MIEDQKIRITVLKEYPYSVSGVATKVDEHEWSDLKSPRGMGTEPYYR